MSIPNAAAPSDGLPVSAGSEPAGSAGGLSWAARRRRKGTLAALALALASGSATAQIAEPASSFSTRELLSACEGESDAEDRSAGFCDGFIMGTGLFYLELRRAAKIGAWACADPGPSLQQIRQDFVVWAQRSPERLDESAIDGFWRAMAETYPCASQ